MEMQACMYPVGPSWDDADVNRYIEKAVDPEHVVESFLTLFLQSRMFHEVVIVRTPFLRNHKSYHIAQGKSYRVLRSLEEADSLRAQLKASCFSHGHFSILFVPTAPDSFLAELLKTGFYERPEKVSVCSGPMHGSHALNLCESADILSLVFRGEASSIFCFSHDAGDLLVIPDMGE